MRKKHWWCGCSCRVQHLQDVPSIVPISLTSPGLLIISSEMLHHILSLCRCQLLQSQLKPNPSSPRTPWWGHPKGHPKGRPKRPRTGAATRVKYFGLLHLKDHTDHTSLAIFSTVTSVPSGFQTVGIQLPVLSLPTLSLCTVCC